MSRHIAHVVLLCISWFSAGCASNSARFADSPPAWLTVRAGRLFEAVNHERLARGIAPVQPDRRLIGLSLRSCEAMADGGRCEHMGQVGEKLTAIRYAWHLAGENVATATFAGGARLVASDDPPHARPDGDATVDVLHERLIASPPHRANILNPGFTHIGVAVVERSDGIYVTEIFATP